MGEVVPKMAQQHLLWVLLACLVQGGHLTVNSTLLTIGSQPNSYNITAGEMMYFRIDIVNDYCNKASVSALSACGQPAAVLRLENCNGETWLYANPYSLAEPTRTSYDMRSKNASIQGYTEELSFTLSQANTYIGVWGVTDAIFQIWVSDVNFNATTVPRVSPILASGTNETMRGFLTHSIQYANTIFKPSTLAITYGAGYITNGSSDAISYSLYFLRLGDAGYSNWTTDVYNTTNSMATSCAVLHKGTLVSTTTATSNTYTMDLIGGVYVMAVIGTTSTGYSGSYDELPVSFTPYDVSPVTDDNTWDMTLLVIAGGIGLFLLISALLFYCLHSRWQQREHAKQLLKEQLERKSLMSDGKAYEPAKKRRGLTCWERFTGEIVTNEDEVYGEDGLTTLERRTVVEFESIEMGIRNVPEPDSNSRRPSQVVPVV